MSRAISIGKSILGAGVLVLCVAGPGEGVHQRTFITVPIIGVASQGGGLMGELHYLAVQIDLLPDASGPRLQFDEGSRSLGISKGAALSPDSKDAVRSAVNVGARLANADPRTWLVTMKNVSIAYITEGESIGAVVAVGIMAAVRHNRLLPKVALTGAVGEDGRIFPVGDVPEKIQGAAAAGRSTVLVPKGQGKSRDVTALAERLRVTVIEVSTVSEAYEKMTDGGS